MIPETVVGIVLIAQEVLAGSPYKWRLLTDPEPARSLHRP